MAYIKPSCTEALQYAYIQYRLKARSLGSVCQLLARDTDYEEAMKWREARDSLSAMTGEEAEMAGCSNF